MKFGWRWLSLLCVFSLIVPYLILEEVFSGYFFMKFMNSYNSEVQIAAYVERNRSASSIGIVVVIADTLNSEQYRTASSTVMCYAKMYGYDLYILDMSELTEIAQYCRQKDLMFRRHCFVSKKMNEWKNEWILFLDADIGIINPNHLIEEYLPNDSTKDIVFYQRIFNQEIMAGSYLFRNTPYSQNFLAFWADYEYKLPDSFHGSDNGALHMVILKFDSLLQQRNGKKIEDCQKLWEKADYYESLFVFEVCVQELLRVTPPVRILILPKGRWSWSRDGWLTNSMWSKKDFMFHGWQKRRQNRYIHGRWHSPFTVDNINTEFCHNPDEGVHNWRYKDTFMAEDKKIDFILSGKIEEIDKEYNNILQNIYKNKK